MVPRSAFTALALCSALSSGSGGSLLQVLKVPQVAFVSGSATLRCVYNLRDAPLYSLKWYHNNTEFYRYVPTERNGPVNIGPTDIFLLHELSRDDRHVTLSLGRLRAEAAGVYKCEVMAEHPSFRTESAQAFMTVLSSRLQPPLLKVSRHLHEPTDLITVGCEPQPFSVLAPPHPTITWFMDGRKVPPGMTSKYGHSLDGRYRGVSVNLQGQQVVDAGGSVQLECQVSLGRLQQRSARTVRVRMEHRSLASAFNRAGLSLRDVSVLRTFSGTVALLLLLLLALLALGHV